MNVTLHEATVHRSRLRKLQRPVHTDSTNIYFREPDKLLLAGIKRKHDWKRKKLASQGPVRFVVKVAGSGTSRVPTQAYFAPCSTDRYYSDP